MATPAVQVELDSSHKRLVWVLNRDSRSYKATFRRMKIEIPPKYEKIGKHVRDGGNLMEYLEACKFVRAFKEPQEWKMDAGGVPQPVFYPKMLFEEELSEAEFAQFVKKTPTQVRKEVAQEEKAAKETHKKAVSKVSRKTLVEDE